jgi:hypothetical protein
MAIKNQCLFAHADFFPAEQFKLIGEYAGQKLLLIGRAKAYFDPIVAVSPTEKPTQEDLIAYDLYELMQSGTHPVNLTATIFS